MFAYLEIIQGSQWEEPIKIPRRWFRDRVCSLDVGVLDKW